MILTLLYFVNFLRTIFVITIIVFIVRWFRKFMESPSTTSSKSTKKEGETVIKYDKKGEKVVDKNEGEYVDFEEVD